MDFFTFGVCHLSCLPLLYLFWCISNATAKIVFMLDTWEGGWDSGSSCWTLGREAGTLDLQKIRDLGRAYWQCQFHYMGTSDPHVGHLGGRLG